MYDILELSKKLLPELRDIGKELDIKRVESYKKQDLIYKILDLQAVLASGIQKPEKKSVPAKPEKIAPKKVFAVMEDQALYEIKPAKKKLT